MKKQKNLLTFVAVAVLIYLIYAFTVWNLSKSPDDLSSLPENGIYRFENDTFVLEIDFTDGDAQENALCARKITITFDGQSYAVNCYETGGHGTPFVPVAPQQILIFETEQGAPVVHFSVGKYKFEQDGFYLLDICLYRDNEVAFLSDRMDLYFRHCPEE